MSLHAFIFESENEVSLEYQCCQVFKLPVSSIYSDFIFTERVEGIGKARISRTFLQVKRKIFLVSELLLIRLLLVIQIYGQDTGYLQCYCKITPQRYHDLPCSLCKMPCGVLR